VTFPPNSYPDLSSPVTAGVFPDSSGGPGASGRPSTPARRFTEPLRELSVLALLAGNAVFLVLGVSGLFLVINGWASDFGQRCAAVFGAFVGPFALGIPIVAVLLATHVAPMVPRSRLILIVALSEYAASAFFGAITFLGAFAYDLRSARATIEGLLNRSVWMGFLILGSILLLRLWMGLFPRPRTQATSYGGYPSTTTYGRPYPGQPLYPQPGSPEATTGANPVVPAPAGSGSGAPGSGAPAIPAPRSATGWPEVPPPPMPAPPPVDADPTAPLILTSAQMTNAQKASAQRADPQPPETGGDATQVVPLRPASPTAASRSEPPTDQIPRAEG
jgi:hypothetical protein